MTTTDRRDATEPTGRRISMRPAGALGEIEFVEQPPSRAYIDRTDATDAQFADELARLDRLDVADEDTVERVARAMWAEDAHVDLDGLSGSTPEPYRRLARSAIDALKPAPGTDTSGQAVQRVLDLADDLDREGVVQRFFGPVNLNDRITARIRAAVAGPQRDHDEEGS